MAQVLSRLQNLLSDVNSGLDDVAALIRLDQGLTSRVIRVSNSALLGRGGACGSIEEAVNRVGFREVYHVVSVAASSALVAQPLPVYGRSAEQMWKESIAAAFGAEVVAERLGEDTAVAYMNGLLHAVGRLAINKCLGAITGDPTRTLAEEGFPADHSGAEIAVLGYSQAEVAACMLVKWGFPPTNAEAVRHQYDPLAAEVPHDRMSAVLYCGRFLRTAVVTGAVPVDVPGLDDVLDSLPLSQEELLECMGPLEGKVNRALQMMKV